MIFFYALASYYLPGKLDNAGGDSRRGKAGKQKHFSQPLYELERFQSLLLPFPSDDEDYEKRKTAASNRHIFFGLIAVMTQSHQSANLVQNLWHLHNSNNSVEKFTRNY
jgi:hypothetical protein